jgi:glutathione S-transferase
MKFYDSIGMNPRTVRMFMAEKGIDCEKVKVDIPGGENRRQPYLSKNPMGQMPTLELDDGTCISEITAICEYLDELKPENPLIGRTPKERAETRMWVRRLDLNVFEPMANGFRFAEGLKMFQDRVHCIPDAAAELKQVAQENLTKLDAMIAGRQWVCGDRFTLADIMLFAWLDLFSGIKQPINPANKTVAAIYERAKARPSAKA